MAPMDVRAAEERDLDQLAQIWYDGWHEAHAERVPEELTRQRTLESFGSGCMPLCPACNSPAHRACGGSPRRYRRGDREVWRYEKNLGLS